MSMWTGNSTPDIYETYEDSLEQKLFDSKFNSRAANRRSQNPQPTVWDVLTQSPDLQQWAKLVEKSGFAELYDNPQANITVFAVPDPYMYNTSASVLNRINKFDSKEIISFNTIKARFTIADFTQQPRRVFVSTYHPRENMLVNSQSINVYLGYRPLFMTVNPTVTNQSRIIPEASDIIVSNGIVHKVTQLIMPKERS
jgi:hypothetical protein